MFIVTLSDPKKVHDFEVRVTKGKRDVGNWLGQWSFQAHSLWLDVDDARKERMLKVPLKNMYRFPSPDNGVEGVGIGKFLPLGIIHHPCDSVFGCIIFMSIIRVSETDED